MKKLRSNPVLIKLTPYIILLALIIPALIPLFHQGMFVSDDANWMIIRLSDFWAALKDGQFPVRWAGRLDNGYGYPVFNFLYPGVYYSGILIHLLLFDFQSSVKILFGISLILSGIFSFLWLKKRFSLRSSLLGALGYVYFPYHLYDIYNRGSLGEALALMVLPLIFYALENNRILLGGLAYAYLILVHNTLAFISSPVLIIYALITKKYSGLKIFFFGILLSCFFWLPALYDRKFTVFDSVAVSNYRQYFLDNANFTLVGYVSILIAAVSLILSFRKKEIRVLYFFTVFFLALFLSSSLSAFFWKEQFLGKLVQFPWRFLSLATISVSFLSGSIVEMLLRIVETRYSVSLRRAVYFIFMIIFLVIIYLSSSSILKSIKYESHPDTYYSTNESTTNVQNEYTPLWVKNRPLNRPEKLAELKNGRGKINLQIKKSNYLLFTAGLKTDAEAVINLHYFPGWLVKIDGKNLNYQPAENTDGLFRFKVPQASRKIELVWNETPLRLFSDLVSLMGLIVVLWIYLGKKLFPDRF